VTHRNVLSTGSLDRLAERRHDTDWLARAHANEDTVVLVTWQGRVAVEGSAPAGLNAPSAVRHARNEPILLGDLDGVVHLAVDLSHLPQAEVESLLSADASLQGLRDSAPLLSVDAGNLLAMASALTTWHHNHQHCGRCGTTTTVRAAGHERHCPNCDYITFPRTDPAVIMLAVDGDRCVLGRQKIWPAGMYSTLAGFVEPGESLEDAVAREVLEEVGLKTSPTSVRYHSSQPWPFPQSVMLGFHVEVPGGGTIVPQPSEIEDAQWFTRDQIRDAREMGRRGFPIIPPPVTIARALIDAWLND
jgi:NAD+ diphosphatase